MNKVKKVLLGAADLVEKGWTQHAVARDKNGKCCYLQYGVSFCMDGAISRAASMEKAHEYAFNAKEFVRDLIRMELESYNDHPDREKEQVVELLRKASGRVK